MPPPIKAVIFDSDGTLVDSEAISLKVMVELVGELGLPLSHADAVRDWSGRDLKEVFAEIETRLGRGLPDDFTNTFRGRQMERLRDEVTMIPGAKTLLESMTLPFCVASNAPQSKVRQCLGTTGLLDCMNPKHIYSAYDVQAWKPLPDLFLYAAAQLGVAPEHCAVVEDSEVGVEAGLRAGMRVFAYDPAGKMPANELVSPIQSLLELNSFL